MASTTSTPGRTPDRLLGCAGSGSPLGATAGTGALASPPPPSTPALGSVGASVGAASGTIAPIAAETPISVARAGVILAMLGTPSMIVAPAGPEPRGRRARRRHRRARGVSARQSVGDRTGCANADPRCLGPVRPPRGAARVGQLHSERLCARRPIGRVGRQRVHDRLCQLGRDLGSTLRERRRLLVHPSIQEAERVAVVEERKFSGEQLVGENAQRVDIGCGGELVSERLLRCHVRRGAEHLAGPRGHRAGVADHLGNAVVGHLHGAVRGEQQVLGLDVSVEDTGRVRVLQRGARGKNDAACRLRRDALSRESLPDRPALQQLHDEQTQALVFDVVVDRHDVGMLQRGQQARLADEAAPHRGIGRERARELLDRNRAVKLTVACLEHDTPASAPDFPPNLVVRQGGGKQVCVEIRHRSAL